MAEGAAALIALQRQIATAAKPVVVELAGAVRAGGLGIVGAADLVIAAEIGHVRADRGPSRRSRRRSSRASLLPRLTARAASDLFLTARTFDAAEAVRIGLVTRAVPADSLVEEVASVLAELVKGYPQGLRETKKLLNHDLVARIDALGDELAAQSAELFGSDEARAAMIAFLNRKK